MPRKASYVTAHNSSPRGIPLWAGDLFFFTYSSLSSLFSLAQGVIENSNGFCVRGEGRLLVSFSYSLHPRDRQWLDTEMNTWLSKQGMCGSRQRQGALITTDKGGQSSVIQGFHHAKSPVLSLSLSLLSCVETHCIETTSITF